MDDTLIILLIAALLAALAVGIYLNNNQGGGADGKKKQKKPKSNLAAAPPSSISSGGNSRPSAFSSYGYSGGDVELCVTDADRRRGHSAALTILSSHDELKQAIARELSGTASECCTSWTLVFADGAHGRSFSKLTHGLMLAHGPVLVVIEQDDDARTTFGCVTFSPWLSVKARENQAKATHAARLHDSAAGGGASSLHHHHASSGSSNCSSALSQAPQFFGDDSRLFIFTTLPASSSSSPSPSSSHANSSTVDIFQTRDRGSLANRNYQYFFDHHPDRSHLGLGIGGSGARSTVGNEGQMAFFLDSYFHGQAAPGGCPTFRSSRQLASASTFRVNRIEIWALDPATIGTSTELSIYEGQSGSALDDEKHRTELALMQMAGVVRQEEHERPDE